MGSRSSRRGRGLSQDPVIGLDLGGTKVYGVRLDGDSIEAEAKRKTPADGGPEAIVATLAAVIDDLGGTGDVESIGVGAPGLLDRKRGVVIRAPNLVAWEDNFPLGPALEEATGGRATVVLGNDVEVAVIGEHQLGAAKGANDVLGIWLGTGVGGGLVLGGEIRRGAHGLAGEVGHTLVQLGDAPCGCGGIGHLEAYAGRRSMEQRARAAVAGGRASVLVDLAGDGRMKSSVWAKALEADDELATELLEHAVTAVAQAVASLQTLLDFELVVIGGGMAERLGDWLAARVDELARPLLFARDSKVRIVPAELGDASGAAGAALMARATNR